MWQYNRHICFALCLVTVAFFNPGKNDFRSHFYQDRKTQQLRHNANVPIILHKIVPNIQQTRSVSLQDLAMHGRVSNENRVMLLFAVSVDFHTE